VRGKDISGGLNGVNSRVRNNDGTKYTILIQLPYNRVEVITLWKENDLEELGQLKKS
jgi:hypothetical protein